MRARTGAVGVLGGYGDIGAHVVRALHEAGVGPLRVGGRDPRRAEALVDGDLGGAGTAVAVDIADARALRDFADGCRVLLNAAGPSRAVGAPVVLAARDVGAHLVDVAGDEPLHGVLTGLSGDDDATEGRVDLLSAGMQPGLTAILPRYLAAAFARAESLTAWSAIMDRFTRAAAEDYLEGTARRLSEPLAAWRRGRRVSRALRRADEPVAVPGTSARFADVPIMTAESERLAGDLRLVDGQWHTLMIEGEVGDLLDRLHTMGREEAAGALCLASRIDMAGRRPLAVLLAEVRGERVEPRGPGIRSGMLRGSGTGALAGAAAAAAVLAVLEDEVPEGLHYAAEVLDPIRALERVSAVPGVELHVVDGPIDLMSIVEEGEL